jgi:hypothetical protein
MVIFMPQPHMTPGTNWIGGWVVPRASLDAGLVEKSFVCGGDRTLVILSVVRHYTN